MAELYGRAGTRRVATLIGLQAVGLLAQAWTCYGLLTDPHSLTTAIAAALAFLCLAALSVGHWKALHLPILRLNLVIVSFFLKRYLLPAIAVAAGVMAGALVGSAFLPRLPLMLALLAVVPGLVAGLFSVFLLTLIQRERRSQNHFLSHVERNVLEADPDTRRTKLQRVQTSIELARGVHASTPSPRPRGFALVSMPSKPWFGSEEFPWAKALEAEFPRIREEVLTALSLQKSLPDYGYVGAIEGQWKSLILIDNAQIRPHLPEQLPLLFELLKTFPHYPRFPEAQISVLGPHSRIVPHSDVGNYYVTCHLPLVIPENCGIRVGGETRHWQEGRCLFFQNQFEHSAWNESDQQRIVLIVDFLHPELSSEEVNALWRQPTQ
jgi:hypothetical protein